MNRTFAVRKECMKKSSSCSFGQMTSSVTCGSVVVNGDKDLNKNDCGENLDEYGDEENAKKTSSLVNGLRKCNLRVAFPSSDEPWGRWLFFVF